MFALAMTTVAPRVFLISHRHPYSMIRTYKREELTDSSSLSQLADDKRVLLDGHSEESERTSGSRQSEFFVRTDVVPTNRDEITGD